MLLWKNWVSPRSAFYSYTICLIQASIHHFKSWVGRLGYIYTFEHSARKLAREIITTDWVQLLHDSCILVKYLWPGRRQDLNNAILRKIFDCYEWHCYHSPLWGHHCLDIREERDSDNFVNKRRLRESKTRGGSHKLRQEARFGIVRSKDTDCEWSHLNAVWRVLNILEKDLEFVLQEVCRASCVNILKRIE